jgi:hypothetical protein
MLTGLGSSRCDRRVEGPAVVSVGDVIRLGEAAEAIVAIACLDRNET